MSTDGVIAAPKACPPFSFISLHQLVRPTCAALWAWGHSSGPEQVQPEHQNYYVAPGFRCPNQGHLIEGVQDMCLDITPYCSISQWSKGPMFLKISFYRRLMCQLCKVALIWLFTAKYHCLHCTPCQRAFKASGSCRTSAGFGNRGGGGPKCILCFHPVVQFVQAVPWFTAPPDDHARAVNTYWPFGSITVIPSPQGFSIVPCRLFWKQQHTGLLAGASLSYHLHFCHL